MRSTFISFADTLWLLSSFVLASGWLLAIIGSAFLTLFAFSWIYLLLSALVFLFTIFVVRSRQIQDYKSQLVFMQSLVIMLLGNQVRIEFSGKEGIQYLAMLLIGSVLQIIIFSFWLLLVSSNPGTLSYYLSGQSDYFFSGVTSPITSSSNQIDTQYDYDPAIYSSGFNQYSSGLGGTASGSDSYVRAKANYAYQAQSSEEISFAKNEIMEVLNQSGNWWKVLKVSGEIGMAPSNYLTILN